MTPDKKYPIYLGNPFKTNLADSMDLTYSQGLFSFNRTDGRRTEPKVAPAFAVIEPPWNAFKTGWNLWHEAEDHQTTLTEEMVAAFLASNQAISRWDTDLKSLLQYTDLPLYNELFHNKLTEFQGGAYVQRLAAWEQLLNKMNNKPLLTDIREAISVYYDGLLAKYNEQQRAIADTVKASNDLKPLWLNLVEAMNACSGHFKFVASEDQAFQAYFFDYDELFSKQQMRFVKTIASADNYFVAKRTLAEGASIYVENQSMEATVRVYMAAAKNGEPTEGNYIDVAPGTNVIITHENLPNLLTDHFLYVENLSASAKAKVMVEFRKG